MVNETSPMEVAENFKVNVLKLIDYLIEILNSDSDLLAVRLVVRMIPCKTAIDNFTEHSRDHRNEIENSNETYFLNDEGNNLLFNDFSQNKVIKFKNFWKDLTPVQKECIWKYFKYFLKLCDRYNELIHKK